MVCPHFKLGSRSAVICAILFSAVGWPAHASDLQPTAGVRLAAVSNGDTRQSPRLARRSSERTGEIWQLVQSASPTTVEGQPNEATILAAFASSTPGSIDEDVAKQHDLEIVKRVMVSSLGLRIVTYRVRVVGSLTWPGAEDCWSRRIADRRGDRE